ncbi:hypothetical protein D3C76_1600960 [compost metagenome]
MRTRASTQRWLSVNHRRMNSVSMPTWPAPRSHSCSSNLLNSKGYSRPSLTRFWARVSSNQSLITRLSST